MNTGSNTEKKTKYCPLSSGASSRHTTLILFSEVYQVVWAVPYFQAALQNTGKDKAVVEKYRGERAYYISPQKTHIHLLKFPQLFLIVWGSNSSCSGLFL